MQQHTTIKALPYFPPNLNTTFKRVLVKPIPKEQEISSSGLIIPTDIGKICEIGIVKHACEGSLLQPGDKVLYNKMDRTDPVHLDTISIEGEKLDALYEQEIWSANGNPFNRIFVEPLSELQVSDSGLILPDDVKGITQKGVVFRAPADYTVQPGDHIEYRKQERELYPTIDIDGKRYEVMHEADVFIVNDRVAPYRIIVKIDIGAQRIKKSSTHSGLIRSQLFLFMLHNMQLGEVMDIGKEAQKNYPDLKVGDQAILHHFVESQPYRLLKQEIGKETGVVTYEQRIINAFEPGSREIFGRVSSRKKVTIVPFGKNKFLKWDFDVYNQKTDEASALFLDFDTNLDKCHNIDDLKSTIEHKRQEGIGKTNAKLKGITQQLSQTHHINENDKFDRLESELNQAKREAVRIGNHVANNHLLLCEEVSTGEKILVPYKELYPINILGKKFLIGYEDFIVARLSFEAEVSSAI